MDSGLLSVSLPLRREQIVLTSWVEKMVNKNDIYLDLRPGSFHSQTVYLLTTFGMWLIMSTISSTVLLYPFSQRQPNVDKGLLDQQCIMQMLDSEGFFLPLFCRTQKDIKMRDKN